MITSMDIQVGLPFLGWNPLQRQFWPIPMTHPWDDDCIFRYICHKNQPFMWVKLYLHSSHRSYFGLKKHKNSLPLLLMEEFLLTTCYIWNPMKKWGYSPYSLVSFHRPGLGVVKTNKWQNLRFGCIGLIVLLCGWPFLFLFDRIGWEENAFFTENVGESGKL